MVVGWLEVLVLVVVVIVAIAVGLGFIVWHSKRCLLKTAVLATTLLAAALTIVRHSSNTRAHGMAQLRSDLRCCAK